MKNYLTTVLALACTVLVIALVVMKHGDDAQHESDASAMNDCSNQLDTAQTKLVICNGTLLVFSNSLDQCQAALMSVTNQMIEAQSTIALDTEQITSLKRQVAAVASENQTLTGNLLNLTNQMTALTQRLALTQTNLDETHQVLAQLGSDYVVLENRLRRDVAERILVERKFNSIPSLKSQIGILKEHPADEITAERIYAGLDLEVLSNGGVRVISPD